MTTKYVWSGATGSNNGTSWTNAYTTLNAAMSGIATSDIIYVAHDHVEGRSSALTLTFPVTVGAKVLCVDRTSGALAKTGVIDTSAGTVTISGCVHMYGLDIRCGTSSLNKIVLAGTSTQNTFVMEECTFTPRPASGSFFLDFGNNGLVDQTNVRLINPKFVFNTTTESIAVYTCNVEIIGGLIDPSGAIPATVFVCPAGYGGSMNIEGMDLSGRAFTYLFGLSTGYGNMTVRLTRCKMPASYTMLQQTAGPIQVFMFDCANGDTHGLFGYFDVRGSMVSDTGIYLTAGAAAQAWKITTTALANYDNPFVSPWVDFYNIATSTVTPYLEILRDGSTTPYTDAQVWGEFTAKVTSGTVLSTFYRDRQDFAAMAAGTTASDQSNGAGTSAWTGKSGTAWSGKVDSGASLTPAENGHIRGRTCVGVASSTVYVDPQIRT